jgi:hypothetical protein
VNDVIYFTFSFSVSSPHAGRRRRTTKHHCMSSSSLSAKSLLPQPPFIDAADLPPPSNNHTAPNSPSTPPVLFHNSIPLSLAILRNHKLISGLFLLLFRVFDFSPFMQE